MRLLVVALPGSIHTARDLKLIADLGWDVHLFPALNLGVHDEISGVTIHLEPGSVAEELPMGNHVVRHEGGPPGGLTPLERAELLAEVIRELEPDLIHSMELGRAGYLTLGAKRSFGPGFPVWVAQDWGMDISLHHRIPEQRAHLRGLLAECDCYWAECQRDAAHARALGFEGEIGPALPVTGGYDLEHCDGLAEPGPVSARSAITVKGISTGVYRAGTVLSALERKRELLAGRRLQLYSATADIAERGAALGSDAGAEVAVLSTAAEPVAHDEILAAHGRSRVSMASQLGDGICTSALDALVMGSFPIFSDTGCGCEWAVRGRDAAFAGPDDVDGMAAALERALTDDELVDRAAARNRRTAARHLDRAAIAALRVELYERAAADGVRRGHDRR